MSFVEDVAKELDAFVYDFDPYDYRDQIADSDSNLFSENREENILSISSDLLAKNVEPYLTFLDEIIADTDDELMQRNASRLRTLVASFQG